MNKADREQVAALAAKLEDLKSQVISIGEELRTLADAEQEKYDNMPEGLQAGDQGQAIETAASALDEAASAGEEGNIGEMLTALESME